MSVKISGISATELAVLARELQLRPDFANESCYIASGPAHEILAVRKPGGLFEVQLLEKAQAAVWVNETIRIFQQFVAGAAPGERSQEPAAAGGRGCA